MHTNATLAPMTGGTDPTEALGPLAPIDQIRRQVAVALFGDLAPAPAIGRFQIQRMLGAGGMGVVYAATDPQLGRTVALKLIQPTTAGERATDRLLREAQAMARLQHPNVVAVHEAGVHGGQVYLAMEYVDGGTLDAWLHARERTWQDVIAVLTQAGDGLAAAHAAGLIHRDFKPANILMSGARARISDFGLARAAAAAEDLERTAGDGDLLLGTPLTRTDVILGTPAYMAPEQLHGAAATAASDQFAFAVVTYEALAGHRPFQADSVGALLTAIERGQVPPIKRDVPASLLTVLRRALAVDPAARFPDMPALLAALRRVRPGAGGRAIAVSTAFAAIAAGLLVLNAAPPDPDPARSAADLAAPACDGDPLADVWDAPRRAHVGAALSSETAPALPLLDAYAASWKAAHALQCQTAAPTTGWSATCLADRRTALADLGQAILVAAPELRRNAAAAAREFLPSLADCSEPAQYLALVSEADRDTRAAAWRMRLAVADAFGPRPTTRAPNLQQLVPNLTGSHDVRAVHEAGLATVVRAVHAPDPNLRLAYEQSADLGRRAAETGHADIAARAWVLAVELLEAQLHPEVAREAAWTDARAALDRLPADHPLRLRLRRDLAFVELGHARHATALGACRPGDPDFTACAPLFAAITDLTAVAADPTATPDDLELLARAHDHAGDPAAAATIRARGARTDLDERSLGYLEFEAATAVADHDLASKLRCTADATHCEIDAALTAALAEPARMSDTLFIPTSDDDQARGVKLFGVRPTGTFHLLGLKNGDAVTAIDGVTPTGETFIPALHALLARGDGTITFTRKGAAYTRRFTARGSAG